MPNNPTLSWERLQDRFYRNFEGYSMLWDVDIAEYIVTSAPYGGAIALCRDNSKLTEYRGPESRQSSIYLYSGAGNLIHKIPWDNGRIRGLGWSELEHLIVVSEHGNARCYYDFEGNFYQFSLGKMAESNGVKECRFLNTGFVALLTNNRFVSVSKYEDPNPKVLAELPENDRKVIAWDAIPPEYALGQHFELVVGTKNGVYVVDANTCKDKNMSDGPYSAISVSPNSDFIILYNQNSSRLRVIGSDFERRISDVNVENDDELNQLTWCGNDAVVMVWNDEITLVGPKGGKLSLFFDGKVVVFPEVDGIRTLTNEKHDFFTRLPELVVDIFKLGSTSPAAILGDCVEQLDRKSPKADENLLIIADRLPEAVDACIEAAGFEFEPYWQKKLLRAASFGKAALDLYNSDKFVEMCEYLRVLNSVRQFDVGILLDYPQLLKMTPRRLIDRLLIRRMHQLAFQCAEYLKLPTEPVYVHWACTKIRVSQQLDDETLCKQIVEKLEKHPGISYETIAKTAYTEGRGELAVTLTGYEPRADRQIPLLLDMQEQNLALEAAEKSYNVNLVVYVLAQLRRKLPLAAFFRMVNDKPMAAKCFERLCGDDVGLLQNFYYQDDRQVESAELTYVEALKEPRMDPKMELLEYAQKKFAAVKSKSFEARAIEEQARLLTLQEQLEKDYQQPFVGQTVSDTIGTLLRMSQVPRATKIKDEFKVPDKRFWWIRLQALVARRDWDNLYSFATSKKSPIGYEPFFNECTKAGSRRNAARYIPLATTISYLKRIEMYEQVGEVRQAAMEAQKHKDINELQRLREGATTVVASEIDTMISTVK